MPEGTVGDQGFYLWAIERARHHPRFADYVLDCELSSLGCFDLRAVPQEWNLFFALGTLARLWNVSSAAMLSGCLLGGMLLNALTMFAFVGTVSRNWTLAGVLALACALQHSLLIRLQGHLPLAAIWPAVAVLWTSWLLVAALLDARHRRLGIRFAAWLAALLAASLASYYYAMFLFFVAPPTLLVALLLQRRTWGNLRSLARRHWIWGALACALVGALCGWLNRHAWVGADGERHEASFSRQEKDFLRYSARWWDFVVAARESKVRQWLPRSWEARASRAEARRGEVNAFLGVGYGVALLGATTAAARQLARRHQWRWRAMARGLWGPAALLLGLFLFALALTTSDGGRLVHAFFAAARCMNRLAPLAALLGAAWAARLVRTQRRASLALTLGVGAILLVEMRGHPLLAPGIVESVAGEEELAGWLAPVCRRGSLAVVPPIRDYLVRSPYAVLSVAERARCSLDGVGGAALRPRPRSLEPFPLALTWRFEAGANPTGPRVLIGLIWTWPRRTGCET